MGIRKSTLLFNGEVVVSPRGIYTFIHYYQHFETGREAILVGMNHVGDEKYFDRIKRILVTCDLVLFENIRKMSEEESRNSEAEEAEMRKLFFEGTIEQSFSAALQFYFTQAEKSFILQKEEEVFDADYNQDHWFSGDPTFLDEGQQREYMETLIAKLQVVPQNRKQEVIDYVKESIAKIERGVFRKQDLGEAFIFFWLDPQLVEIASEALGRPRDLYCFQEFDKLVQKQNPQKIGIKFGAGHIYNQRSLLEERGYVHQKSEKLRNISFKKK